LKSRCGRESGSGGKDGAVAGVELGAKQENRRDAADDLGKVCRLFGPESTVEEGRRGFRGELAVAEPLLEDLVAAQGVIPNVHGDCGPPSIAIEINVDASFTEEGERVVHGEGLGGGESGELFALGLSPGTFGGKAATGHDGAALPFVAPTRCELERLFEIWVERELEGGEEGPLGDEVDAGLGVEEFGEATPEAGGVVEQIGCGG
jgi:hypothetical protein